MAASHHSRVTGSTRLSPTRLSFLFSICPGGAGVFGFDDLAEVVFGGPVGLAIVAGGVAVAVAGPKAKPLVKKAMVGYIAATDRAREWAAEAVEQAQDLYAEARYEYQSQLSGENDAETEKRPRRREQPSAEGMSA
jgi:hypothetical protein